MKIRNLKFGHDLILEQTKKKPSQTQSQISDIIYKFSISFLIIYLGSYKHIVKYSNLNCVFFCFIRFTIQFKINGNLKFKNMNLKLKNNNNQKS